MRAWARRSLAKLSRGGGNGDEIRMGILNIMRDNGIREGHRPVSEGVGEGKGREWEQWQSRDGNGGGRRAEGGCIARGGVLE